MANISGREVKTNDLAIMGTGAAALVFGFFPWFSLPDQLKSLVKAAGGGQTSEKGWSSGFLAFVGLLLLVVAAGIVAARIFGGVALPTTAKAGPNVILLGIAALGTVFVLLKLLVGYHDLDRSIGIYLTLLAGIGQSAFAFLSFQSSGEAIPEIGGRSFGGGTPPPPPPSS